MKRSRVFRRSFCCLALVATASLSAAAGDSAVIRTQKLEFTGQPAGAAGAKITLRTQQLEFAGTADSGGAR